MGLVQRPTNSESKIYGNWAREAQRKELLQVNFDKSAIGLLLVDAYLGNKAQS